MGIIDGRAVIQVRANGITLVELMIVILVASILVSLALPGFERFTLNNLLSNSANEFAASLNHARAQAIKARRNVRMCPSSNGNSCSTVTPWAQGWITFEDTDGNGVPATSELRQARGALDGRVSMTVPAAFSQWLQFRPTGAVIGNAGNAGSFNLCVGGFPEYSRFVAISATGRVTLQRQDSVCPSS